MKKQIALIAAVNRLGYIGNEGKLMYRISEDLRRFRSLTTYHVIIMGRKTYEDIGSPLPTRINIVLTTDPTQFKVGTPGLHAVDSLDKAIELATALTKMPTIFVIGGAKVYEEAIKIADVIHLTVIDDDAVGDVKFPTIDKKKWLMASCSKRTLGRSKLNTKPYQFIRYVS